MIISRSNIIAILIGAFVIVQFAFAETPKHGDDVVAVESVDGNDVPKAIIEDEGVNLEIIESASGNGDAGISDSVIDDIIGSADVVIVPEPWANDIIIDTGSVRNKAPKADKVKKTAADAVDKPKKAAADDGTKFRISGYLETGFDIHNKVNRNNTEYNAIATGELEISARPVGKVRAELGIEYDYRDTFLVVDKFYGQYAFADFGTLRAGIMKKSFGLEERAGLTDRYLRKRSVISSVLNEFGLGDEESGRRASFLDHDLTLQYRHDLHESVRLTGAFSWSLKDSLIYLQNYAVQYNNNDNFSLIAAVIIRHDTHPENTSATFASSLSAKYNTKILTSETELTLAANPRTKGVLAEETYITGIREQIQFPISINTKTLRQIIPTVEAATVYWYDIDGWWTVKTIDTQIRGGITLGFAKNSAFQIRTNYGTILRTQNNETKIRRHRLDSEALVIF